MARPGKRFLHTVSPSPRECEMARKQIGWSPDRLAEAAGVQRSTIVAYERGVRTPRVGTLIAIRRALRGAGAVLPEGSAAEARP